MKVTNWKVYDLEESIVASGYPMRTEIEERKPDEKDMHRCDKLVLACQDNNAHGQFMSGLLVSFDLTCSNKMWVEMERYKFMTFVSSQSTMHRIAKFDLRKSYNEYVDPRMIEVMEELKKEYENLATPESYLRLLYSNPAGFELTARLTTNYRCLRNIYKQRKNHRLPEWREFCKWMETLPYAKEFIIN
jgi:hypothetical protein